MKKTIILSLILITAFSGCRSANDINNNSETASPDSVFSLSDEAATSAPENISKSDNSETASLESVFPLSDEAATSAPENISKSDNSETSSLESVFPLSDETAASTTENISKKENGEYISYNLTSEEFSEYKDSFTEAYCDNGTIIALGENGNVITWGSNYNGKIGNGEIQCYESMVSHIELIPETPYCIDFNEKIVNVGISESISYAITESGEVFMWGRNDFGETGVKAGNITEPTKIDINREIKKIDSGSATFLFLTKSGEVLRSGIDFSVYERLEDMRECVAYEYNEEVSDKPYALVFAVPGYESLGLPFKCKDVSVGLMHYAYLSEDGEVYVQGKLLGDYDRKLPYLVHDDLYKIDFPEKITSIESGSSAIVALSESGNVYLYGRKESVFFDEASDSEISENVFKKGGLENIISICCGTYCITAVDSSGNALGFGFDYCGVIDSKNNDTDSLSYEIITHPRKISDGAAKCTNDGTLSIVILKDGQMLIQGSDACKIISYLNY